MFSTISQKKMNKKTSMNGISFLFVLLVLFSLISSFTIVSFTGVELKPFYIVLLLCLLLVLNKKRVVKLPAIIVLFIAFVEANAGINGFQWGIDRLSVNYILGVIIISIFCTMGRTFSLDQWSKIFRLAAIGVMIAVYINSVMQWDKFIFYFSNTSWMGHPYINTLITGGVNLEATWIAILSPVFYNHRLKWPYLCSSLLISALYASRVGIMLNAICAILFLFKSDEKNRYRYLKIIVSAVLVSLIIFVFVDLGLLSLVITRFLDIGNDNGSIGRLTIWSYVAQIISEYPFGVGIGNSMLAVEKVSGITFGENNLHNLPLQMFCELGWLGGVFFLGLLFYFIAKEKKNIFNNPFVAMLILYFIISLVQLRGGESIFFCILGVYICLRKRSGVVGVNYD